MKFRNLALATAAVSLAVAPAIAQSSFERSSAPIDGESEVAGASTALYAIFGAALIAGGILAASGGDDDDPVSP